MTQSMLQNCGKCGLCLNVCPVYQQLKEEQASPRAKLQLIKAYDNNTLESSPFLKEILSKCLMCGSCAANCPSGIDHYSKFMEMRQEMVASQGETPAIKSLIYLLARDYRLKFGAGLARTGQKLLPERLAQNHKLGNIPLKNFPKLNTRPFRDSHDTRIQPEQPIKGKVIYFTGCATNYLYADTGIAVTGVLKHLGYEVVIPEKQTCCSIPLLFHGAADMAGQNIAANINALKDTMVDAILVDCSTCGDALKHEYPAFVKKHGGDLSAAEQISEKVTDILSFIHAEFHRLVFDTEKAHEISVTYHAPCHSKNRFHSHILAEALIKKLPFATYRKTSDMLDCCGGGGTFFYEYPEISKKMVDKKIENAKGVKATHWLTDCPVCRLNLAGNLNPGDKLKVLHPVTLIYAALKQI